MRVAGAVTAVLLLLVPTGCAGSGGEDRGREAFERVLSAVHGLEGAARERKLVELAKAEGGRLSVYTSLTSKTETALAEAFEDSYGIDTGVYRGTSETVAQRVSQEARAGFRGTDALETGGDEMAALAREGVFVPYDPRAASRLVQGSRHDGWTATRFTKIGVTWNTDLVPRGRQPRSWEELADPRWRGRLALEGSDAEWYKSLREHWVRRAGRSEAEADRLFGAIARNSRVVSSHAVMTELLGAGEYAVAASNYAHLTRDSIAKGAPVELDPPVEPIFSRPQGVGLLATAEHPAAAVLYVEWLLDEGQEVLKKNNVDPARRDLSEVRGREVLVDVEGFVEHQREWTDRYDALLRLGTKVDGEGGG